MTSIRSSTVLAPLLLLNNNIGNQSIARRIDLMIIKANRLVIIGSSTLLIALLIAVLAT